jgi:hypothetical protein
MPDRMRFKMASGDLLHGFPGGLINSCRVMVGQLQFAPHAHPQVSLVAKEGRLAVLGLVDDPARCLLDDFVGAAFGS